MPVALGFALFQLGVPLGIVNFVAVGAGASIISALGTAALGFGATLVSNLLAKNNVPTAEDGKYNLKQNVPPLTRVYGRVKKGGDYAFLEEKDGVAHHVIVVAGHEIESFPALYLHDDLVTLDGSLFVVDPLHYYPYVGIDHRLGANVSTAYTQLTTAFSDIWTADHRGDGLATLLMICGSVPSEELQTVYPNGMPVITAEVEGAKVYDSRGAVTQYTSNLALIRADHLTHPSGGAKLTADDLYWPDWENAANVADQTVYDRDGNPLSRYHGGLWYRYTDSQVEVGRLIDQAADLVIYERADGKVGVHAGEYVEPDIRLTADDIFSIRFDANKRRASNVLAVRGRFTDPAKGYNTVDAAIYGDPYVDEESERAKTLTNQVVQAHNHMARLQKLAFIRANAPRVSIVASYEAARNVPYRRFIRVHMPPKLNEAVLEIIGRPTLSLKALTYSFDAIVVPEDLYDFDAATEEGAPGSFATPVPSTGTPIPTGLDIVIGSDSIGGGARAAYAACSWDAMSSLLRVEVQWAPTAGGAATSQTAEAGATSLRTPYLTDGVEYKFRARAWAPAGRASPWTSYVNRTATADPTAPPAPLDVAATGGVGEVEIDWRTPNSTHFASTEIYRNSVDDFDTATLVDVIYSGPSQTRSYVDTVAAGTWFYWLTSVNASGIESAEEPTGSVTVT